MKAIPSSVLLIAFALLSVQYAQAKKSPYVLGVVNAKHSSPMLVRLKNRTSGHTIWTRTVSDYRGAYWSEDHRAVAVETTEFMLVWRLGHRLLKVAYPGGHELDSGPGYDYSMGYRWSPDKRHLLVRFGISGSVDLNYGWLYCLKFGEHYYNYTQPPTHRVWKMAWQGNHTVLSWYFDFDALEGAQTPRRWHVP
jgi:hypothetical protein